MPLKAGASIRWPVLAGYGLLGFVSSLGIAHAIFYAVSGSPPTLWQRVVPVVLAFAFAGALLVGFSWALGRLGGPGVAPGLGSWALAGWGFFGALALVFAFMQEAGGGAFIEPFLTANLAGLGGSVLSLFMGAKYVENALERERAEHLTDHLTFFLRLLRHDIRNDATMIHGYADLLLQEESREAVTFIRSGARHILDLTHLARAFSRSPNEPSFPVPVAEAIGEAVEASRERYPKARIRLEGGVEPTVSVMADDLLPRVIENLVTNAVQHNPSSTPTVNVTVGSHGGAVHVRVEDNGPGVPEEVQERLFEEGIKGRTSGGTGLGLFLVKTLVEAYGGTIRLEDTGPEGSTFVVELPEARSQAA